MAGFDVLVRRALKRSMLVLDGMRVGTSCSTLFPGIFFSRIPARGTQMFRFATCEARPIRVRTSGDSFVVERRGRGFNERWRRQVFIWL